MEKVERQKNSYWLNLIENTKKQLADYEEEVKEVLARYELNDGKPSSFNLLWSNTETLFNAIYNIPPVPDIRQRWEVKDNTALAVAEILDRALTYAIEQNKFDEATKASLIDYLLAGRAVLRIRYNPTIKKVKSNQQNLAIIEDQNLIFENVTYNRFYYDLAMSWEEVEWIAFVHYMGKEDAKINFPERYNDLVFTDNEGQEEELLNEEVKSSTKALLYEVWDKRSQKVYWVSKHKKDGKDLVFKENKDFLGLQEFFPITEPLFAIKKSNSLIPSTLFSQYKSQVLDLENISKRIKGLVKMLKVRGAYDQTVGNDLEKIFQGEDGDFVPVENAQLYREFGGIKGAIFLVPIGEYQQVLAGLYQSREDTKNAIYEITGISDIIRGVSNPSETATAQQLKANWGSSRIDGMKRAVQIFLKNALIIASEIIAEHFEVDILVKITSCEYPKQAQKQAAENQISQMKQMGQKEIPKELSEIIEKPSLEEIQELLHSDKLRAFKIDIETDSTIAPNQLAESKALGESMQMLGGLMGQVMPAVQSGIIPKDLALALLASVIRKTPLSNELTSILQKYENELKEGNPLESQLQTMKQEMSKLQQELESKQAEIQVKQEKNSIDKEKVVGELQLKQAELTRGLYE